MVVTTNGKGHQVLGLNVGAANARRYFPKDLGAIELRLGDLQIQCKLPPEFWNGHPEIRDPRLSEWLKFKTSHAQTVRKPIALAMVQSGVNSFTLQSVVPGDRRSDQFAA